ncbi:MAG: amidohydrolase family protein [Candidatus Nezhaarchaeota archaeon]|nr:amidohydrolase family protein [Candidatus Nezhaarchaeota archaeon]
MVGYGRKYPHPPESNDPKERIKIMDRYGVDVQVLSQTAPVLTGLDPETAKKVCEASNNAIAEFCAKHPERFAGLAIVSLLDVDSALEELDRAIMDLGLKGVTIPTNVDGEGLDYPQFRPFFERVSKHDVPVFLHPVDWLYYPLIDMRKGWMFLHIFGWPFDTTQAMWRLIFGGVLDEFPNLKIVAHHCGAMLPFFVNRVYDKLEKFRLKEKLRRPITEYWKQIYGDTALDGINLDPYYCGYAFFGPDRLLFGTDYPFGREYGEAFVRDNLKCIKSMNIPEDHKENILGGNAQRLLKLK